MTSIHPLSDVQTASIGDGTSIWQYCVVLRGAKIGKDCNICSHVFIENDVVIGDRVTIKNGVQLWDGVRIADDVFVGPNVTFTNDLYPKSKQRPERFVGASLQQGASIGANATILPGVVIGRSSLVGAGAVVTRDVPAYAIVRGSPARITGYTGDAPPSTSIPDKPLPTQESTIAGVDVLRLPQFSDMRGDLLAMELRQHVPFKVSRFFFVMNVPSHHVRGEHAHRECHQMLVCLHGRVSVVADNGIERSNWVLDRPDVALHIHPMVWAAQYAYEEDAVLAVAASHEYDSDDYIREYEEFLKLSTSRVHGS